MGSIDIVLLVILAAVTWCVASEGIVGAAIMLFNVLFAGLLTMNFYEPLVIWLERNASISGAWSLRLDFIVMVGFFTLAVSGLRTLTDYLIPNDMIVDALVYDIGRWLCGLLTGYITMAFLLTSLHTSALPREFLGFRPERANFFNVVAPDRQWIGFTQYVSEHSLSHESAPRIFDGPNKKIGNQTNEIWPSFPIRYADRRGNPTMQQQRAPSQQPSMQQRPPRKGSGHLDF